MSTAGMVARAVGFGCVAALAVGTHASAQTATPAEAWPSYVNQRFSYVVEYSSALLRPKPEAGNGDGREFHARKGAAVIAVWGEYAQGPSSQREEATLREPDCVGGKATYRFSKPLVQVISCVLAKGGILYGYSQQRKDTIVMLEATYPEAEKSTWDPVVQHMIHSLQLSDSDF